MVLFERLRGLGTLKKALQQDANLQGVQDTFHIYRSYWVDC